jgi:S-DNA-T family DNA segregation ATPase FtsK/SpoIIIE
MEKMVQKVASYIILSFTLIILASFVAHVSILGAVAKYIRVMFLDVKDKCGDLKDDYLEKREMRIQEEDYEDEYEEQDTQNDALTAANEFAFDNKPKKKAEKKAEKKEEKKIEKKPKTEKKIVPEVIPQPTEQFSDGIDEVFGKLDAPQPIEEEKTQAITAAEHDEVSSDTTQSEPAKEKASKITEVEKNEFHQELNSAIEKPPVEYVYPTIDLLNEPTVVSGDQREEMRKTAEKLIAILDNFGVKAKLLQVTQGPTVTRYEIQPDTGIKLSKIVGLADDIALNLAVSTVLIAPVPGKAAVGVEIPNKKVASVSIREILDTDEFKNAKSKLTIALGKDIGGNVVIGDIGKMPHVLIAGATGSGKSVCINTIIMSILYKASPEDVKLIMVDPKVVELGVYNGIPHLLIPVVTEPKKAAGALNWAVAEMMRRYELFKETSVRKLESYNKLMESTGGDKIPQIVIIIDELADLMMVAAKEVEDYIVRLTQLARAAGIHLIIATQRPSVDVITGLIKANVPSRIAFAVSSQVDSRTILDKGGAEKLLGMGDMLYYPMGARSTTRVQGAFVSDSEIERILEFIKENMGESHYSEDLAEHIERCATGENGVTPDVEDDGDPLLQDAIQLAVECGKISTSLVQRRLSVGYSRAGRIIDQMEARGIISGANGSKPRDVLISHADMAAVEDSYEEE